MKQGTYSVGTLGLPEQELRLIKSMLKLTSSRPQGSYESKEGADLSRCDVVIVNADDAEAMATWQTLIGEKRPPMPILITNTALICSTDHYFSRPISMTKILALLDCLAEEIRTNEPEQKIFSGKSSAEPGGSAQLAVGSPFRRALVVDDSPTVRKQLELELQESNINVDSAETGEAGLALIERNYYDIIFLDVVLPGADGYQVCKNIKKNPASKETPVVMLTSKSSPFDRVRGSLAGCDSYLTKPVDYEKFKQVLDKYIV